MVIETRRTVSPFDLGRGIARMVPELPQIARTSSGLLLRRPESRGSIGAVFERIAARQPGVTFIKAHDGTFTYRDANVLANRYAWVLRHAGVRHGDVVGLMSGNSADMLIMLLATVKLGAISGLLNTNQRGDVLAHSLGVLDSRVLVLEDNCRESFDTAGAAARAQNVLTFADMRAAASAAPPHASHNPPECANIRGYDSAYYVFTSGTTGMPKASIMTHHRWLKSFLGLGGLGVRLRRDDTLYCCLPLYHNNAVTVALGAVLSGGGCMAIGRKFSAGTFWDDVIRYDATSFVYIGELCRYLLRRPVSASERSHRVRVIVGNGMRQDIWKPFRSRFGIGRIAEFYGASECSIAFINAYDIDETAGTCPLPYAVVQYDPDTGSARRDTRGRVVRVKRGETGLLLAKVTKAQPFDGYTDADATEKKLLRDAVKSGDCWFVTGDLVRQQGMKHVAFVDRLGDTFRWKGENVATTEVEAALEGLHGVEECVVYGVEVPGCDGRAGMAAVVMQDGETFHAARAGRELTETLPGYAVPLFVREVAALEHTSTFKSRKVELRDAGFEGAGSDPVWVYTRSDGYVPFYAEYPADVAGGRQPA